MNKIDQLMTVEIIEAMTVSAEEWDISVNNWSQCREGIIFLDLLVKVP